MHHLTPFKIALADPLLRVAFVCILLMGPAVASIGPFQSVIGIERLGMSNGAYAAVVTVGALFSVVASVVVGIVTDQTGRYRGILMACICVGILAGLLMSIWPSLPSFLMVHLVLFPIAATTFTQYFALASVAASRNPDLDKDVALSLVRAGFAGTFALAPPIWAVLLARGVDLLSVYWLLAVINVIVLFVVYSSWPKKVLSGDSAGSGLTFFASLRELSKLSVLLRLSLVTLITSSNGLYNILLGLLIVNSLNGREADIGIFVGAVALTELPVMLAGSLLMQRFTRQSVMLVGAVIYSLSLASVGMMPSMAFAWFLILPFGIGAGLILSVPVGYIQDLVAHRPGAGSSLISMSHFGGTMAASAIFALVAGSFGYVAVAIVGGVLSIAAAVILYAIDLETTKSLRS